MSNRQSRAQAAHDAAVPPDYWDGHDDAQVVCYGCSEFVEVRDLDEESTRYLGEPVCAGCADNDNEAKK